MTIHPLDLELFGTPRTQRREVVLRWYQSATGVQIQQPLDAAQAREVGKWMAAQLMASSGPSFLAKVPTLTPLVHASMHVKANVLTQLACSSCPTDATSDNQVLVFSVDVEPWSAQSESVGRRLIREAVAAELRKKRMLDAPWGAAPVCMSVAAVVPRTLPRKDVDNLVKGLLDSMNGLLYPDDRLVQCLQIRRLEHAGADGYYLVRAQRSPAWDDDVIFDEPVRPVNASGYRIQRP